MRKSVLPPRGFTNAAFDSVGSPPVAYTYNDGQYWDDTEYMIPGSAAMITATLYYQTTCKEYVEFLRDENVTNDWGDIMYNLWETNGRGAPEVMRSDTVYVDPLEYPDVTINMIPDNTPVTVNPGGFFTFTGILTNNSNETQSVDVWLMLDVPGIGRYGPLNQYNNIPLSPGQEITVPGVRQDIPSFAPLGTYNYVAFCGQYDYEIIDSSSFNFEVVAPKSGDGGHWTLSDWFETPNEALPSEVYLTGNYPNPFNSSTEIHYALPGDMDVRIDVYNVRGQLVETLVDGVKSGGYHQLRWDASQFSSGLYFYKLTAGGKVSTGRMTLLK
ncbi:MAG: T9SS type A sorting domain-containing protein [candidate division Zixibacteria bacterium]|nr:T9SS type A sorting domain-containing protein [candidate division Zixibacteria bacterium]